MPFLHPSHVGNAFVLTPTLGIYVGPDKQGKGPILAIFQNGSSDYDKVAEFRNATGATRFCRLLQDHIDMVMEQAAETRPDSRIPVRGEGGKIVGYAEIHLTDETAIEALKASSVSGWSVAAGGQFEQEHDAALTNEAIADEEAGS